jgi:hypothetical protein
LGVRPAPGSERLASAFAAGVVAIHPNWALTADVSTAFFLVPAGILVPSIEGVHMGSDSIKVGTPIGTYPNQDLMLLKSQALNWGGWWDLLFPPRVKNQPVSSFTFPPFSRKSHSEPYSVRQGTRPAKTILGIHHDPDVMRAYKREWHARRRREWMEGKSCEWCRSSERLEIDHIDPELKASNRIWSWSKPRRDAELAKCRVLCYSCHKKRHQCGHGTRRRYSVLGCRCVECRAANTRAKRDYRERRLLREAGSAS